MIGSICVVHINGGGVHVGRFELRGIYAPAYGFVIVADDAEHEIDWREVHSILRVGSAVVHEPDLTVIANNTVPRDDDGEVQDRAAHSAA